MPILGSSGGASEDIFPALSATPAFDGTETRFSNWRTITSGGRFWGFNADGDYVDVLGASIEYYNSSGTLQWTVNSTDFNGTANVIVTACKHGAYIYAVAAVSTTTAAWIAKIDSSGTVSNITSLTYTNVTATYKRPEYNWLGVPSGLSDLYLVGLQAPATSFNLSTLSTVTTVTGGGTGNYSYPGFLTSKLQTIGGFSQFNSTYGVYSQSYILSPTVNTGLRTGGRDLVASKFLSNFTGVGITPHNKFFYWDGHVIPGASDTYLTVAQNKAYTIADFDDFAIEFAKAAGVYKDETGSWS